MPDGTAASLSPAEIQRYARHLIMPEVAMAGQTRLKAAKVLCIGAGGLGSPLSLYLAAAGVGTIGLVDFDVVDVSNLQRQIIHFTADVGRAQGRQRRQEDSRRSTPMSRSSRYEHPIDSSRTRWTIFAEYDVIVDGTDNFPTRYLVNDACVLLGKPNVYGSIFRFEGRPRSSTRRKVPATAASIPSPRPRSRPQLREGGVLGILPGMIGVVQATETVKLILGTGQAARSAACCFTMRSR